MADFEAELAALMGDVGSIPEPADEPVPVTKPPVASKPPQVDC